MEHERQSGQEAILEDYSREFRSQKIINDILKISLSPYLFQEILERILAHLTAQKSLHLIPKAAVFLVNSESQVLQLEASHGLSKEQISRCEEVKFGLCHCGRAAEKKAIHFFQSEPPLHSMASGNQESQGHYCIPIICDEQAIGVLALYVKEDHELSVETEQLLRSIANILASVIKSQKMDQQMVELVNDLHISIISLREEKLFSESVIQNLNHG